MDLRELFGSDAPSVDVTALAYDNRAVAPGTAFFCVRGMTRDGLRKVLENGPTPRGGSECCHPGRQVMMRTRHGRFSKG